MSPTANGVGTVLVVDNHDSFVHTLVGYLYELGARPDLIEADRIREGDIEELVARADGILISPGPGAPAAVATAGELVRAAAEAGTPVLGVCLGHQVIAEAFGAVVAEAPELCHGVTSAVHHDSSLLFEGISSPFAATRYHSLAIEDATLPWELEVTARTDSGVIMGIAHRNAPVWGVQFHPESVLTEGGYRLLANWLAQTGVTDALRRAPTLRPRVDVAVARR